MHHMGDEMTINYIEGCLSDDQRKALEEHLKQCGKCARLIEDWKEILDELRAAALASAPPEAVESAIRIFQLDDEKPMKTGTIFASLFFDSLVRPAFAGVRGPQDARQIVLRTENMDIDLHISEMNNRTLLWGQLLPRLQNAMTGRVQVTLLCDGRRIQSARTNECGEFRFEDVPAGELSIGVYLPTLSRQVFGVFKIQGK